MTKRFVSDSASMMRGLTRAVIVAFCGVAFGISTSVGGLASGLTVLSLIGVGVAFAKYWNYDWSH